MDSAIKPVIARQIAFIAVGFTGGLILTILFGPIIGICANIVFLLVVIYMIRMHQGSMKAFGFGDKIGGRVHRSSSIRIKYLCLLCSSEVKGTTCKKCGSSMKKPAF